MTRTASLLLALAAVCLIGFQTNTAQAQLAASARVDDGGSIHTHLQRTDDGGSIHTHLQRTDDGGSIHTHMRHADDGGSIHTH
ncbi:MAG TPA: hypothetical protein VLW26_06350 [Steroidobacteraceae bacterium]|nr:hypothetical protein [Steroidobacteraceae bacterium]